MALLTVSHRSKQQVDPRTDYEPYYINTINLPLITINDHLNFMAI